MQTGKIGCYSRYSPKKREKKKSISQQIIQNNLFGQQISADFWNYSLQTAAFSRLSKLTSSCSRIQRTINISLCKQQNSVDCFSWKICATGYYNRSELTPTDYYNRSELTPTGYCNRSEPTPTGYYNRSELTPTGYCNRSEPTPTGYCNRSEPTPTQK